MELICYKFSIHGALLARVQPCERPCDVRFFFSRGSECKVACLGDRILAEITYFSLFS